jgi:hypothetical protein
MMADEDFISADQLQVARGWLADRHDPIFRRVALVNAQQRCAPFVNGEKVVVNLG